MIPIPDPFTNVSANQVIAEAELIAQEAIRRSNRDVEELHKLGYVKYAAAMSNMRFRIETALSKLIDELEETDGPH